MTGTKKSSWFLAVAMALLGTLAVGRAAEALPTSRVFAGQYDWSDGGKDALTAEFVPDGDGRWKVTFRFRFDGEDNTWQGSAEGDLEDGSEITGTAWGRVRQWTFSATVRDGVLRGTHGEFRSRGKTRRTGTFELRR